MKTTLIGIEKGTSKKTGKPYTVLNFTSDIPAERGTGKRVFSEFYYKELNQNIKIGSDVNLSYTRGSYNGQPTVSLFEVTLA